jgi:hypothetical protein
MMIFLSNDIITSFKYCDTKSFFYTTTDKWKEYIKKNLVNDHNIIMNIFFLMIVLLMHIKLYRV